MASTPGKLSLSSTEREDYLDALIAVVAADGVIDANEIIKLYELFSLLDMGSDKRREIIEQLVTQPEQFDAAQLGESILANDSLKLALAKDLTLLRDGSSDNAAKQVAKRYLDRISLTQEQAEVLGKFIAIENQILKCLGAGKEWVADEKSWKELVSRAAAVGVPLAALNVAGIAGFGAAGITSGLAALGGMSGLVVLGLNPMTAGIGALILGGVAVKKVADYVLSSGDSDKVSQLELYKIARAKAREAINSDLPIVTRERKRDLLRPKINQRRSQLRSSMRSAIEDLSS